MGTYHGHQGAIWTVDVDPTSTVIASGSADNTIKLWEVQTGKCLMTWDFPTAVKRVEFNEDGTKLLGVTEKRMGHLGTIVVLDVNVDPAAEQNPEKVLTIVCDESKATVAGWSYISKYIIAGHEDGSVSQYDGKNGDLIYNIPVHELGMQVTDLQWSPDRTYLITASKDKTARLISARDLEVMKTYAADTPLNSATITPKKDFVILGGGQAAMDVTTTAARQGKFEARFYHKIFEDEVGRVRGHFGPLVSLALLKILLSCECACVLTRGCYVRTPSPQTPPARAMHPEERTVTSACTTSTRATSISCTRSRGNTRTGCREYRRARRRAEETEACEREFIVAKVSGALEFRRSRQKL